MSRFRSQEVLLTRLQVTRASGQVMLILSLCFPAARQAEANIAHPVQGIAAPCGRADSTAAVRWNGPFDVMRAISPTETERRSDGAFLPRSWTVGMDGQGVRFHSPDDAALYADRHAAPVARSFDVGSFQIIHSPHRNAFGAFDAIFDPVSNADRGPGLPHRLQEELGGWSRVTGAHQSRTPECAKRCWPRPAKLGSRIAGEPATAPAGDPTRLPSATCLDRQKADAPGLAPRVDFLPLLQASGSRTKIGSLPPLEGMATAKPLVPQG